MSNPLFCWRPFPPVGTLSRRHWAPIRNKILDDSTYPALKLQIFAILTDNKYFAKALYHIIWVIFLIFFSAYCFKQSGFRLLFKLIVVD